MTYKNLVKFISDNDRTNIEFPFDLMPCSIKSKIILCVGDTTGNVLSFLSSIMNERHSRYLGRERVSIKNRFFHDPPIEPVQLCDIADRLIKSTKKSISNESLLFLTSLRLLADEEYLLLDVSKDLYLKLIGYISPLAIIFATKNVSDIERNIELLSNHVKYIISLGDANDYSRISTNETKNGVTLCYASSDKITVRSSSPMGTDIFHYDYPYHLPIIDQKNVPLAHLAIEASCLIFSAIRPKISKGLEKAKDIDDLQLYSLSPTVLLRVGKDDFVLHHTMRFDTITDEEKVIGPTTDTIFCGSEEFIERVKSSIK